jgi:hypothetical protein
MANWLTENRNRHFRGLALAVATAIWLVPFVFGEALEIESAVRRISDSSAVHLGFLLLGAANIYVAAKLLFGSPEASANQDH